MRILPLLLLSMILVSRLAGADTLYQPELYAPTETAIIPEHRIEDIYPGAPSEEVLQLKNVKGLKFDIPLVKRDFPFMQDWPIEKIFSFFEEMAGIVSIAQSKQERVNSQIVTTGKKLQAYRPPGYGRAVIRTFEWEGQSYAFEVKMSGVGPGREPHSGPHGNGLGTLGEVIREDQFENVTRASIAHAHKTRSLDENANSTTLEGTVAGYGIMYAGYDVRHADGTTAPAGIYIRQAHKRMNYDDDIRAAWLPAKVKDQILQHLSRYGFYTGWESNIQGLVKNHGVYLFDFGHWIAWQGYVPEANLWVDPKISVDFRDWGWDSMNGPDRSKDQWRTSTLDRPFTWAYQTAASIKGKNGLKYLVAHYDNMVTPLLKKLNVGIQARPYIGTCQQFFINRN